MTLRRSARVKQKDDNPTNSRDKPSASAFQQPSRKRPRTSQPVRNHDAGASEDEFPSDSDESGTVSRTRKRKRGGGASARSRNGKVVAVDQKFKKVRGKLGLLQRIVTDMPLDVIFEIFLYLEPLDILRLSRTSRDLRDLLTSRSSEYIWRTARLNVEGLPPLPPDLNEMQYANLAFDNFCHACGHHPCDNILWDCRLRSCLKCVSTLLDDSNEILVEYPTVHFSVLQSLVPNFSYRDNRRNGRQQRLYSSDAYRRLLAAYQQLPKVENSEGIVKLDEDQRIAWFESMEAERNDHLQHVALCEAWVREQRSDRVNELEEIRRQRRKQIETRLRDLGWGPELEILQYSSDFAFHKTVKQTAKLTDRGWAKIAPALIEMMQGERAKRLRCDTLQARFINLKERYEQYILDQGLEESGYPPFGDIIASEMFQAVIWDTPLDEAIADDAFDEGFTKMQEFIERWIEQKTQVLLQMIRETSPDVAKDSLRSASTVLCCRNCGDYLWYPRIFNHPCQSQHSYWHCSDPHFDPYSHFGAPWNTNIAVHRGLVFPSKASQIMKTVLQVCGLPIDATIRDLDSLNPLFECKTCTDDPYQPTAGSGRVFLRWPKVLIHGAQDWKAHTITIDIREEHKQKVLAEERAICSESLITRGLDFHCNYCPDPQQAMDFAGVKVHLESESHAGIISNRIK
ncbi:hypothetical protein VKT23_013194 [Stygiomarasmius scandens]|uniref:F-box domain-containing protein n=1 Tax=Marasmiellus scandens TaxID=2682957 RepID=A0ABR1J492_9AGAR